MTYKWKPRKRNYRRKRNTGLATAPRMMSKTLRLKRMNQVSTKTFYFKVNSQVITSPGSDSHFGTYRTRINLSLLVPAGWPALTQLYDQFKVLGMTLKLFPAAVGTEPAILNPWNRGDQVLWTDQRWDSNQQIPQYVSDIINNASARMINPRSPVTRSIWRPKGVPGWGSTSDLLGEPDPWDGAIFHIINNAPAQIGRPLWYSTLQWKVTFRGRQQD